ncbi:MAG: sensor domain-containing diguanylate cyclase [Gallionella sp.]|nr:MAG: sensor domain-containing diguanylate cyclase [Gallionella sp.]
MNMPMSMAEQFARGGGGLPGAELLQIAFDRLGDAVFWLNPEGRVVYANEAACRSLGCSCEEILAYRVPDFSPSFSDESWRVHWREAKALGSFSLEALHRAKSGRIFPVEVMITYLAYGNNEFNCAIARDISARKHMEEPMRLAADIYMSGGEAVMVTDENNLIVAVNPAFTRITGYTLDDLYGKTPGILHSGMHDQTFYQEMWRDIIGKGHWQGEIWDRRKSGEPIAKWVNISLIRHRDGSVFRHVAQFSDITEKKKQDEIIWQYANFDTLTGLPNRRSFFDRLGQEVKKANRTGLHLSLLFIDLDEFKQINDRLGHDQGDLLLIEAARRIGQCVRETDTVARLGGDEFTVILPEFGERQDIERIAQAIVRELGKPFMLEGETGTVSASVGIALYPVDAQDISGLLKCADRAMYEVKKRGRNSYAYVPELSQRDDDAYNAQKRGSIYLQRTEK